MTQLDKVFVVLNDKTKASEFNRTANSASIPSNVLKLDSNKFWKALPHCKELFFGLLRTQVVKQQVLKSSRIQAFFEATGIYPFNEDTIYSNAKCLVPLEMRTKITAALPALAKVLQKQGELFGSDIEHCTGLVLPMADSKDKRVLHQCRSVLLTHPAVQERENTCKHEIPTLQRTKAQRNMVDHLAPRINRKKSQLIWLLCEEQRKVEVSLYFIYRHTMHSSETTYITNAHSSTVNHQNEGTRSIRILLNITDLLNISIGCTYHNK